MSDTTQRTCIITFTPDNPEKRCDIQTGAVTTLEILDLFKTLMPGFATKLCDEYKEIHGKAANEDMEEFEKWVKFLRASKL